MYPMLQHMLCEVYDVTHTEGGLAGSKVPAITK